MRGVSVDFNGLALFEKLSLRIRCKRDMYVYNNSNDKGSSLLGTILNFMPLDRKAVGISNALLTPEATSRVQGGVT